MTTGELARRTGIPPRTLQAWAEAGLLRPRRTTRRSHRRWYDDDLERAALIRALREEGVALSRVARALGRLEATASEAVERHRRQAVRRAVLPS